jgi:hypothetical protein
VVLTVDGQDQTQEFTIQPDPDHPEMNIAAGSFDDQADEEEEEEGTEPDPGSIVH